MISTMIRFYKAKGEYGGFANYSNHGFEFDNKWWPSSEHYYQAQKFPGTSYAEEIRQAPTAKDAARLGRDRSKALRDDWEDVKREYMLKAVLAKFRAHTDLKQLLISTGNEEIIEATTIDYYWGCGTEGTGRNEFGKILMIARRILANE